MNIEEISKLQHCSRTNWIDRPDILEDCFFYKPTYGISGALLYNYEESDKSFRERIIKQQEESKHD